MKICLHCGSPVEPEPSLCCTNPQPVSHELIDLDGYRIIAVIHSSNRGSVYKAISKQTGKPYLIRLYPRKSGFNTEVALYLRGVMHRLRQRSDRSIVQYLLIQQTREGLWFTVSEWIDALNWGDLIALKQKATAVNQCNRH